MKRLPALLLACLLLFSCYTAAGDDVPPWKTKLDDMVNPLLGKKVKNLVVGVIDSSGKRHYITYGDKPERLEKLDENTIFEIGSITKTFTSLILADAVLKGEVKLDEPVQKYLPETLAVPKRGEQELTLEELATHTSGLPKMPPNFMKGMDFITGNPFAKFNDPLFAEGLKMVKYKDEKEKPKFMYSNIGVGLLGYGMTRRFGKSYEELVQERVMKPIGMASTSTITTQDDRKRLITGYTLFNQPGKEWEMSDNFAGCGALRSTAADMLTYLESQMGCKETPLREAMDMTQKPRSTVAGKVSIGLGWLSMETDGEHRFWFHDGVTGAYCAFAGFSKDPKVAFVLLSNRVLPLDTSEIGIKVMRVLVDGKKQ